MTLFLVPWPMALGRNDVRPELSVRVCLAIQPGGMRLAACCLGEGAVCADTDALARFTWILV